MLFGHTEYKCIFKNDRNETDSLILAGHIKLNV